jgi:hypothetical protein
VISIIHPLILEVQNYHNELYGLSLFSSNWLILQESTVYFTICELRLNIYNFLKYCSSWKASQMIAAVTAFSTLPQDVKSLECVFLEACNSDLYYSSFKRLLKLLNDQ